MKKKRFGRFITGIIVLIVVYLLLSAFGFVSIPKIITRTFFGTYYRTTGAEAKTDTLDDLHQATVIDPKADPYTYRYSKKENLATIQADSARCEACHGDMLDESEGKPKYPIHKSMLDAPGLDFSCIDCHKKVDLGKRNPSRVTRRVDRTWCPACHNPSGTTATAQSSDGEAFATVAGKKLPDLMSRHGKNVKEGKQWILDHPRVAMSVGLGVCKECHIEGSELDFCRECHLRGGIRPSSHRVVYKERVNELYPGSTRKDVVQTKWRGYHPMFVRKALEKLGAKVDSPRNLPLDKVQNLSCGACHRLKDWCTRCHIKHAPNWLNPNEGHPAVIDKFGKRYCNRCHDSLGSKCVSCHTYVGRLQ